MDADKRRCRDVLRELFSPLVFVRTGWFLGVLASEIESSDVDCYEDDRGFGEVCGYRMICGFDGKRRFCLA